MELVKTQNITNVSKDQEKVESQSKTKRGVPLRKLLNLRTGQKIVINPPIIKGKLCLFESGGKKDNHNLITLVTNRSFGKKIGFCLRGAKPGGRVAAIPIETTDRFVVVTEKRNAFGSIFKTFIFDIVCTPSDTGDVIMSLSHVYTSNKLSNLIPEQLQLVIYEKLDSNNTKIYWCKYFKTFPVTNFKNIIQFHEKLDINGIKQSANEEKIKRSLLQFQNSTCIVKFDEIKETVYYFVCTFERQNDELVLTEVKKKFKLNLKDEGIFQSNFKQHLFNSSSKEKFKQVFNKLTQKCEQFKYIYMGLR